MQVQVVQVGADGGARACKQQSNICVVPPPLRGPCLKALPLQAHQAPPSLHKTPHRAGGAAQLRTSWTGCRPPPRPWPG